MRPPQLAEQRHVVGSNPFYHPLFERAFATKDARDFFFQSVMFDRLKSALRDVVVDYYRSIAADTGKHGATFFVEKLMDAGAQREMVLSMFPEAKEILLVRDLRDVLCSRKNFTKQLPEDPITPMRQSAKHLIGMARNGGSNAIVVRYEESCSERTTDAGTAVRGNRGGLHAGGESQRRRPAALQARHQQIASDLNRPLEERADGCRTAAGKRSVQGIPGDIRIRLTAKAHGTASRNSASIAAGSSQASRTPTTATSARTSGVIRTASLAVVTGTARSRLARSITRSRSSAV